MKYAVIRTGGKQYRVQEGDELNVEKLSAEEGETITFGEALLFVDEKKMKLGQPRVNGLQIEAKVLKQFKGEKIRVARFRHRGRYAKTTGHRQRLTRVKITKIGEIAKTKKTKA